MNKILKNTSILMIGDFLTRALSILYLIPLLRLDPYIGTLNATLLIPFGLVITIGTMGINIILTNEVVKNKDDHNKLKSSVYSNIIVLFLLTLISFVIIVFGADFIVGMVADNSLAQSDIDALITCTRVLGIGVLIYAVNTFFRAYFIAKEDFHIVSITYISEQIIKIGLLFLGLFICFGVDISITSAYVYVLTISIILSLLTTLAIFVYVFFKRGYQTIFTKGTATFEQEYFKYVLIASVVIFASGSFAAIYDMIDMTIFNSLDMAEAEMIYNEYFTSSMKLVLIPISMAAGFISVMITHIGSSKADSKVKEFDKMINVSLIYSFLAVVVLAAIGDVFYEFMYGYQSLGIFAVQIFIIPFYITRNMLGTYVLTNNGKNFSIILALVVGLVLKIALDFILFYTIGINGFVMASMISIAVSIAILIVFNRQLFLLTRYNMRLKLRYIIYFLLALIVSTVISNYTLYFFDFRVINIGITAIIALLIFGGLYFKEIKKLGDK